MNARVLLVSAALAGAMPPSVATGHSDGSAAAMAPTVSLPVSARGVPYSQAPKGPRLSVLITKDGRLYVRPKEAEFGDRSARDELKERTGLDITHRLQGVTLAQLTIYFRWARILYEERRRRLGRPTRDITPASEMSKIRLLLLADQEASFLHLGWVRYVAAGEKIGHIELGVRLRPSSQEESRRPAPKGSRPEERLEDERRGGTPVCNGVLAFAKMPNVGGAMFGHAKLISVTVRHADTPPENEGSGVRHRVELVYTVDRDRAANLADVGRRVREVAHRYRNGHVKEFGVSVHVDPVLSVREVVPLLGAVLESGIKEAKWGLASRVFPDEGALRLRRLPGPGKKRDLPNKAAAGNK